MVISAFDQKTRSAFTMIELIFAIVIISITVVSLPMMTQATSRSIDNNFVQEAIFASGAEVMQAFSFRWDQNSAENNTTGELSKVINTAADCDATSKRPGHITRSCYSNLANPNSSIVANAAGGVVENLNDAAAGGANVFTSIDGNGYGYKKNYKVTTVVSHPANFNGANNNLKRVQATVTDPVSKTSVVLEAFSANIGEVIPIKRGF